MSIALRDIAFAHSGGVDVLHGAGVEAADGELVAVMGGSGSGKTTLLSIAAGFLTPRRGVVLVDGRDVTRLPPERRNLGLVPQGYALFPSMTAAENVGYPLRLRGVSQAERTRRVRIVLARVGMSGFIDRLPSELSGGQRQRVALARALVFDPAALLLDEPLSALDAGLRRQLREEIRAVQRRSAVSCILVTHDADEAMTMADRVMLLDDGRVLQSGSPDEVYRRPVSEKAARLTGAANSLDAVVIDGQHVRTDFGQWSCRPHPYLPGEHVTALVRPASIEQIAEDGPEDGRNRIAGLTVGAVRAGAVFELTMRSGPSTLLAIATRVIASPEAAIAGEEIVIVPRETMA